MEYAVTEQQKAYLRWPEDSGYLRGVRKLRCLREMGRRLLNFRL